MIYLDNSSTTRQADEVTALMSEVAREDFGNPSSLHRLGLSAQNRVTLARKQVAKALGATPEEICFNSCGTEGDSTVISGVAESRRHRGNKIITSAVEHPAVLEACARLEHKGFEVVRIPVDGECRIDMERYEAELDERTVLVSVMTVNNETGAVMPVRRMAEAAHAKKILFHTDAVQALGKIPLAGIGADFITVSGHKIHGPKGTGALYIRKGTHLPPLLPGGGQEKNMRSGTENVPGIAGLGEACRLLERESTEKMASVRTYLLEGIREQIPDIRVNSPEDGAASVLNISFLGTRGEVLLHTLEEDEIYVSTGSACSSNKKGRSHVLSAMGLSPKEIEGAIRFSFSRYNTVEEMDVVLGRLTAAVNRFRRLGSFR